MSRQLVVIYLVFGLILAFVGQSSGQASFVTSSATTSTSSTFTYSAGSGYNRLIVFAASRKYSSGPGTITGITFGAQAFTVAVVLTNTNVRTEIWYLRESQIVAAGNCATITVTWSTNTALLSQVHAALTLKDVDQSTVFPGAGGTSTNSNGNASSITTGNMTAAGVNDLVLYASSSNNARTHAPASALYLERSEAAGTNHALAIATKEITTAATENPQANWTGGVSALINVGVVFNGVTATTQTFYSLGNGAWDLNTTWSLTENGSAVAVGIWPRRYDNAVIRPGHTVTIDALTDNFGCGTTPNSLGIANVGAGGGGASFASSGTTAFWHAGVILVRGILQETGGTNDFMSSGSITVFSGGTFSTASNFYNLGYFEVKSGGTFSSGSHFVISGSSTSQIDGTANVGNDFGIDFTSATICGSGTETLIGGSTAGVAYTNSAGASQICTGLTLNCSGVGCSGFPVPGTGNFLTGNTGPAGVGNALNNVLWLRSSDISQANNTAVTTWSDASGNSLSATQSSSALRPFFFTNVVNTSIPAVRFTGTGPTGPHYLTLGQPASLNFVPRTSEHSYFSAVNVPTGETGTIICKANNANRQWQYTLDLSTALNHFAFFRGGDFNTGSAVSTGAWKIGSAVVGTDATTGFSAFSNGTADYGPGTINTAVATGMDVLVGARRDAGTNTDAAFYLTGDIGEIILYDLALSTVHRVLIENYLAAKFNITGLGTEAYTGDAAGYDYDVAGIGQAAGVAYSDARGRGVVRMWNPSALNDGEYLMWGHNNTSIVSSTTSNVDGTVIRERLSRIWTVTETGDVGTVNVQFDLSALTGTFNGSSLRLMIDRDGNFATNDVIYTGTYAGGFLTFVGVNFVTGDLFTLGNTDLAAPLPIEMINLHAAQDGDAVRVEWTTLTEVNNDYFTVERSTNGESWEDVSILDGAGNSTKKLKYTAYDEQPQDGTIYYRVKQTDFDGTRSYSNVVRVQVMGVVTLKVYPNPSSGIFTIAGPGDLVEAAVNVLDVLGRPVNVRVMKEEGNVLIDGGELAVGIYIINISSPHWVRTLRVMKE